MRFNTLALCALTLASSIKSLPHSLAHSFAAMRQRARPLAESQRAVKTPVPEKLIALKQSPLMGTINDRLALSAETKRDLCKYAKAPIACKALGLQAQIDAGIASQRRVAIYTFDCSRPEITNGANNIKGCAGPGYMVLREFSPQDNLGKFTAYHEAQHILNNDSAVRFLLEHPDCVRPFIKHEEQEEFNLLIKELQKFCQNFDIYALAETHADICAAYYVNCCQCIINMVHGKQAAQLLSSTHRNSLTSLGYICYTILFAIAQDLKNHGRYCPLHKPSLDKRQLKLHAIASHIA